MNPHGFMLNAAIFLGTLALAGCGASEAENARADKSRTRLELEEKTRRETEAANKLVTDFNRRLFAKPPADPAPAPPPASAKP